MTAALSRKNAEAAASASVPPAQPLGFRELQHGLGPCLTRNLRNTNKISLLCFSSQLFQNRLSPSLNPVWERLKTHPSDGCRNDQTERHRIKGAGLPNLMALKYLRSCSTSGYSRPTISAASASAPSARLQFTSMSQSTIVSQLSLMPLAFQLVPEPVDPLVGEDGDEGVPEDPPLGAMVVGPQAELGLHAPEHALHVGQLDIRLPDLFALHRQDAGPQGVDPRVVQLGQRLGRARWQECRCRGGLLGYRGLALRRRDPKSGNRGQALPEPSSG